jgi:glycosyltransferase involved in cell wall biosynthesis
MSEDVRDGRMKLAIFGTHPKQFNGYSKVVYELFKEMDARHDKAVKVHVFGFQNFHNHPGHRNDIPAGVDVYDAHTNEVPKAMGFGVPLVKSYMQRVKPDVCVVFNDMMVLCSVLNELKDVDHPGYTRKDFKIVAYIDQVYACQKREFIEFVNRHADAAMAFTNEWRRCIESQGLTIPCYVLNHGINPKTYFPVPKALARRFFGLSDKDFLVLNLNRNQPRKRWDTCLQAFAEVVKRLPDAPIKLVIGTEIKGAWNLLELYERELTKRGIPLKVGLDRIVIPGHPQLLTDDETNILYNIADVGINTCDGEGFGLCNFEQGAVGVPQIVPRLGGFVCFFDDSNSTMVDPRLSIYVDSTRDGVGGEAQLTSHDDYADAIVSYYQDRGRCLKHGLAARRSILAGFRWSAVADEFTGILKRVCPMAAPVHPHSTHAPQQQPQQHQQHQQQQQQAQQQQQQQQAQQQAPPTSGPGRTSRADAEHLLSGSGSDKMREIEELKARIEKLMAEVGSSSP